MKLAMKRGWTLIELTIILVVLSIICAILAPNISRYVHWAKINRAREDVQAIGNVLYVLLLDTGMEYLHRNGNDGGTPLGSPALTDGNRVDLMVGDGDVPDGPFATPGFGPWGFASGTPGIDRIENHLSTNTPSGLVSNRYRTVVDLGIDSEFAWRGPYMTAPIIADPWGQRYMGSVAFLDPRPDNPSLIFDSVAIQIANREEWVVQPTVILSAGPDGTVDTQFYMPNGIPGGYAIGGDDIGFIPSGGSY